MKLRKFIDSIAFRISISISLVVAATTIAVGWLILTEEKRTLEFELQSKGRYLADLMSHNVVEPLLYEERHEIFSLLNASMIGEDSLVVYAEVYDKYGEVVATTYKDKKHQRMMPSPVGQDSIEIKEDKNSSIYHISLPIHVEALGTIGFLRLGITKEFLYITLKSVRQKLYLLAAAIIFIGIMLGLWMARKILRPILILHNGVRSVGEGEVGVEVPVVGEGEIKELALSFNRMSKKLKELINETRAAQENLVRTEKLYAVGEFSAGVAHEIKNPLTSIKMLIQTVKQKKQALSSKDIEILEEEINRIDRIVKDFLAFARPKQAEKTSVNVNEVIRDVITLTGPKMEQSFIKLIDKVASAPSMITGNYDALKQAFLNLVLNAIQAMDSGGGTLEIVTSYESGVMSQGLGNMPHNTPKVSVIIKDTGIGIPEKNLKKIFDPFFTTKEDGTGMGLALTYNIINDHSGRIDIDSTPFMGTTVKAEFPYE